MTKNPLCIAMLLFLAAFSMPGEVLQMELSIFGMD